MASDSLTPERLAEIREQMIRFARQRMVTVGGGGMPAPSTYLADGGLELLAEIDRLRGDPLTPHESEVNERAQRVLMSNAEAHRLVQENVDIRAERDEARAALEDVRAMTGDAIVRMRDAEVERDEARAEHVAVLAEISQQVGRMMSERDALRAAGDAMAEALDTLIAMIIGAHMHSNPHFLHAESWAAAQFAETLDATIIDRWRALRGEAADGESTA